MVFDIQRAVAALRAGTTQRKTLTARQSYVTPAVIRKTEATCYSGGI